MSAEATSRKLKQKQIGVCNIVSFLLFSLNVIIIVLEVTELAVPCHTLKKVKIKPLL